MRVNRSGDRSGGCLARSGLTTRSGSGLSDSVLGCVGLGRVFEATG
jgi:hypothetical protein